MNHLSELGKEIDENEEKYKYMNVNIKKFSYQMSHLDLTLM